MKCRYSIFLPL